MKSPTDSRARFVETTASLLRRQGYHATGLNQIIKQSGAPKGSLYFHFPGGKEELAEAALQQSGEQMHGELEDLVANAKNPLEALRSVANTLADSLEASDFQDGCPVATVVLEAAAQSERLQVTCAASYRQWEQLIAASLRGHKVPSREARSMAGLILSAIEGALLLSRAYRDTKPLRSLPSQLRPLLG